LRHKGPPIRRQIIRLQTVCTQDNAQEWILMKRNFGMHACACASCMTKGPTARRLMLAPTRTCNSAGNNAACCDRKCVRASVTNLGGTHVVHIFLDSPSGLGLAFLGERKRAWKSLPLFRLGFLIERSEIGKPCATSSRRRGLERSEGGARSRTLATSRRGSFLLGSPLLGQTTGGRYDFRSACHSH
jgi:hypothetical protein